jgi:hypothetical protein
VTHIRATMVSIINPAPPFCFVTLFFYRIFFIISILSFVLGHKKAIGELVAVSANRINEWLKIWSAAHEIQFMTEEVQEIMRNTRTSSLSNLVSALHRAGWSSETIQVPTTSQVSFYEAIYVNTTESDSSSFRINSLESTPCLELTEKDDSPGSALSICSPHCGKVDVGNWFELIERRKPAEFFKPVTA